MCSFSIHVQKTKLKNVFKLAIGIISKSIPDYYKFILPFFFSFLHLILYCSSKRLAPVLIKEVTRRVNLENRWQAVYTAGVVLPKPVARCQYFHRTINAKKLFEVNNNSNAKEHPSSVAMKDVYIYTVYSSI